MRILPVFRKELLCDGHGSHGIGPTGIKRKMGDCFYQFFRSDTVLDSSAEVKSKLVRTIHRDKCSHRDQTSVALGQFLAFPNISEKDVFGQLDKLGCEGAEQLRSR